MASLPEKSSKRRASGSDDGFKASQFLHASETEQKIPD
jgi:hypothetical protein